MLDAFDKYQSHLHSSQIPTLDLSPHAESRPSPVPTGCEFIYLFYVVQRHSADVAM
jgi:hypothetical protein